VFNKFDIFAWSFSKFYSNLNAKHSVCEQSVIGTCYSDRGSQMLATQYINYILILSKCISMTFY